MNYFNWLVFSFRGRINRKTFWLCQLAMLAVSTLLLVTFGSEVLERFTRNPEDQAALDAVMSFGWKINLVLLWPKLAIDIKRFQDRDRPWYWVMIQFIPLIGPIWYLIEAGFMPGTAGPNRYGPGNGNNNNQNPPSNSNDNSGHFEA
ncbi:DUF805 domain-containing protein [Neiella marina]|uniref:DUF805 domain-containing protein n=1 Tax=Neiella marina TaxID=508461 RepID=A0A8J2U1R8_9GAMM|nr:DUF805 domain-containing protein [Neiella marina]GGA64186.1 DUF805 domain-containing protein [Neiella marina]